ncbi:uncharacterized protein PFL1_03488 [Pseudozyma flocculosa PF-1]|uniref:RING-CH-type domain-containing protein n=2 Tax=Pseudozyma flocculosa TaxID=84751 RepID=A0A5C3FCZ0_9BASI|nr:uncharacterized protein PFL1_03488 [Pseudozyma flocculosa PF-1]EPQ29201.1 hypothetical protein PFL1_03488 [Pseudozyma flocculosa PF-1]SPO41497.1 uncharacterized protein PSFLO_06979 [Pseudozyma flocculosa]
METDTRPRRRYDDGSVVPLPHGAAREATDRTDEAEVERLLGAAQPPSLWASTHDRLRELAREHWDRQPAPLPLDDRDSHDDDEADERHGPTAGPSTSSSASSSRSRAAAAAAEAEIKAQIEQRRRHRSPTPAPERDAEGNERICRLCFADEHELNDDGTSMGRLISPCRCRGSMKYVHASCLSQWRHKSRSSEAARVCGQCSSRYLFPTSPWTPVAAFLQASQPLKILISFVVVAAFVVVSGTIGTAALYGVAAFEGTRLDPIRTAALELLQPPKPPWNITLSKDAYEATVNFDSTFDEVQGIYGSRKELMIRASLDVIQKIKTEHGDEWAAYRRAQQEHDAARGDDLVQAEHAASSTGDDDEFDEDDLLSVRDEGGQYLDKKIRRRGHSDPAGSDGKSEGGPRTKKSTTSSLDPVGFAQALTERLMQMWSGHVGDHTPTDASPQSSEEGAASDDQSGASDGPTDQQAGAEDAGAASKRKKGGPELSISYNFMSAKTFGADPTQHILVRRMPEWTGPLRFVPYALYIIVSERLHSFAQVPAHLWTAMTRCAVLLSILVCESRREVVWTLSKVVVAATIAFIDEHFQAAPPLPPNAVLLGPPRSRSRRWAWRVREALSFASTTVFGLYWLNWWGGLPLSTYLGPRTFSSAERVELSQLGPIFGPIGTSLVDFVFLLLGNVSGRAHRFRERHTRWWKRADWVQHDRSAAEGYRRMLAAMLGDADQARTTRYDMFLEREDARLLPGRVRPVRLATLPRESRWATIIAVGCLVTVVAAFGAAMSFAWETSLVQFYQQAVRSTTDLIRLLGSCVLKLRALPSVAADALRRAYEVLRGYWPLSTLPSASQQDDGGEDQGIDADNHAHAPADPPTNAFAGLGAEAGEPGGGAGGDDDDEASMLLSAAVGCCASIYGCFHGSMLVVRFVLTYLPMAPFATCYVMLEEWIHFDLAQQEVLDRNELPPGAYR